MWKILFSLVVYKCFNSSFHFIVYNSINLYIYAQSFVFKFSEVYGWMKELHRTQSAEQKRNKKSINSIINISWICFWFFCYVVDDLQANILFKEKLLHQKLFKNHVSNHVWGRERVLVKKSLNITSGCNQQLGESQNSSKIKKSKADDQSACSFSSKERTRNKLIDSFVYKIK